MLKVARLRVALGLPPLLAAEVKKAPVAAAPQLSQVFSSGPSAKGLAAAGAGAPARTYDVAPLSKAARAKGRAHKRRPRRA